MASSENERKYSTVFDLKVMNIFNLSIPECHWRITSNDYRDKSNVFFLLDIIWLGVTFLFLSFSQSETVIYLVTEPVRPLEVQLNDDEKSDLAISWGLHQITVCSLNFLYAYYHSHSTMCGFSFDLPLTIPVLFLYTFLLLPLTKILFEW